MIVDDQELFLQSIVKYLGISELFHVLTAANGEKALRILESEHVDLVVTDLRMPVMDGFELLSHMKESYPDVPAIVMSTFLNSDVENKLRSMNITQYIDKSEMEKLVPAMLSGLSMSLPET